MDEWNGEEFKIAQCLQGNLKGEVMRMELVTTIILTRPSRMRHLITVRARLFENYVGNDYIIIDN